ncbi:MAG TPA: multicopper oxidase domain-containing protein [Anaeromyxobacteraceae bacterium]|nr:multicopper oxidase domain-containing protein [Anaeromyxobacteraceae bacterium]
MRTIDFRKLTVIAFALGWASVSSAQQVLLDPGTQPRFVNKLPMLPAYTPGRDGSHPNADYYEVEATQFEQWLGLCRPNGRKKADGSPVPCDPRDPAQRLSTTVWGFGQVGQQGSYPGHTFEAVRNRPVVVKWINNLKDASGGLLSTHILKNVGGGGDAVDETIHGADPITPGAPPPSHVRLVVHNHGAEVRSDSDGFPEFWFTNDPGGAPNGIGGPAGNQVTYSYPNQQPPATLWYHDHSLGVTRLNVYAGLAGFYLIRDEATENKLNLPSGQYEIPLIIQDRMFNPDGSLFYIDTLTEATLGNPYHPKSRPEFFGDLSFQDFIMVNGMLWPYLEVEPRKYRFRILNASNARMFNLRLLDKQGAAWPGVYQIGSDGGYLGAPVRVEQTADQQGYSVAADGVVSDGDITDATTKLFAAPAERLDVVIDFSSAHVGSTLTLLNDALAPFPGGSPPSPGQTGDVMQFRVVPLRRPDTSDLPGHLNYLPTRLPYAADTPRRRLILTEVEDPQTGNPAAGLIGNTCWDGPLSEDPALGSTEIWEIVNLTPDTHPIHLHLVEFNLLDRQQFDRAGYLGALDDLNGGGNVQIGDIVNLAGPSASCPSMTIPGADSPFNVGLPGPFAPNNKGGSGNTTAAMVIPDVTPFLRDPLTKKTFPIISPNGTEAGFKDTVRVKHGTVTRFVVKFAPQDPADGRENGDFRAFDATLGRYVWHCHILDHEDNEMMRPYALHRAGR